MKKIFERPVVKVINLGVNDVIATSGIGVGGDITPGQNIPCDAPGRFSHDWDDEY